jgi:hypothetical protein
MGLLKHHGKVEFVNKESVHRMSLEEARAFLVLSEAEIVLFEKNILALYAIMDVVKEVQGLRKRNEDGYYIHTVIYEKLGGE